MCVVDSPNINLASFIHEVNDFAINFLSARPPINLIVHRNIKITYQDYLNVIAFFDKSSNVRVQSVQQSEILLIRVVAMDFPNKKK